MLILELHCSCDSALSGCTRQLLLPVVVARHAQLQSADMLQECSQVWEADDNDDDADDGGGNYKPSCKGQCCVEGLLQEVASAFMAIAACHAGKLAIVESGGLNGMHRSQAMSENYERSNVRSYY